MSRIEIRNSEAIEFQSLVINEREEGELILLFAQSPQLASEKTSEHTEWDVAVHLTNTESQAILAGLLKSSPPTTPLNDDQDFDGLLREIQEEEERQGHLTIPSWSAMLTAVGATIAHLDDLPHEHRTSGHFLASVHYLLDDPSTNMPSLVQKDERAILAIEAMLHLAVNGYRDLKSSR